MKALLSCFVLPLAAAKNLLPFRRTSSPPFPRSHGNIGAQDTKRGTVDMSDYHDLLYIANVTVGSSTYPVQLDSGSSDLVIFSTVSGASTSSLTLNLTYGTGYAYGSVSNASVTFGGLTVSKQAFVASTSFSNPVTSFGAEGILGLGFTSLSTVDFTVSNGGGSWGRSFLYNAFAQTPTEPNFITFALTRSEGATALDQGGFTIGAIDPAYTNVQSTNAIPTWPMSNPDRWSILLDAYELSNGTVPVSSSVTHVPSGKAVLLLDTGSSYLYAPSAVVTAVYGSIKGAQFDSSAVQWNVPCNAQVYLGLWIGGRRFDLHPLDLVVQSLSDSTKCVGSIIPQDVATGGAEFDILAGDVFLRNVYTVFDFGDFASPSNLTLGNPYVKLLSTTNITAASLEFDQLRGGNSTISLPANSDGGGNVSVASSPQSTASPSSTGQTTLTLEQLAQKVDHINSYEPILIAVLAANAVIMLILAGVGIMYMMRRRSSSRMSPLKSPPAVANTVGAGPRPFGRSLRKRGAATTASTMELTANEPSSPATPRGLGRSEYAPVSLDNPEGDITMYNPPEHYRNSGVPSFRTEPYRDSAVL